MEINQKVEKMFNLKNQETKTEIFSEQKFVDMKGLNKYLI